MEYNSARSLAASVSKLSTSANSLFRNPATLTSSSSSRSAASTPAIIGSKSASSLPDLVQSSTTSSRTSPNQSIFIVNPKHQPLKTDSNMGTNASDVSRKSSAKNRGRGRGRGRGRPRSDSNTARTGRPNKPAAPSSSTQAAPPPRRAPVARGVSVEESAPAEDNQTASVEDEESSATDLDALFDSDISSPESGWETDRSQAARESEQAAKKLKVLEETSAIQEGKERRKRTVTTVAESARAFVNHDYCDSCQQGGEFVCCESCPRSFHFICAEPPVDEENLSHLDHWYCKTCASGMIPTPKVPFGPFKLLIENMLRMNPVSFSLPEEIRRYFDGVSWNTSTGDFVDTKETKSGRGRGVDADLFRLNGEEGDTILCHVCGKSALHGPIITCDFCPLSWHLDCLNPPMTHPLPPTKKWMCPTHAEYLMQKNRKVGRYQHYITLTDPALKNDGDIEVVLDEHFPPDPQIDRRRRITYKIPERSIKLKFMEKLQKTKSVANRGDAETNMDVDKTVVQAPAQVLSLYGNAKPSPPAEMPSTPTGASPEEAQTWLLGLASFYSQVAEQICPQLHDLRNLQTTEQNLDMLYRAATGKETLDRGPLGTAVESSAISKSDPLFQQFLAWKELMQHQDRLGQVTVPSDAHSQTSN